MGEWKCRLNGTEMNWSFFLSEKPLAASFFIPGSHGSAGTFQHRAGVQSKRKPNVTTVFDGVFAPSAALGKDTEGWPYLMWR